MSKRLSDEDRRAVDFLLDRNGATQKRDGDGSSSAAARENDDFKQRVLRANETLQLLSQLPTPEPPPNLVNKVFARIDQANLQRVANRANTVHPAVIRPTL